MSITTALAIAGTGVSTYGRLAEIAADNIANADVEGFVRKEADLVSLARNGEGRGVNVAGILRHASEALARDARREAGVSAFLGEEARALAAYATELGQPDEGRSITDALSRLEGAFINLAETPESPSLQREAVEAARAVADGLNRLSGTVRQLREDAEGRIEAEITVVNRSLADLQRVNDQIKLRAASGQDVTALEDQRDRLVDAVAERIPVRIIQRSPTTSCS